MDHTLDTSTSASTGSAQRLSAGLNAGLTQVLADGTNTYIYGADRIAQVNTTTLVTDYFLTDALGSVRQLTDAGGAVTYIGAYDPYGITTQASGASQTSYGFTGEYTDPGGMVYLRARYYLPGDGRFLTRDTWEGNENQPMAFNLWNYVKSNPINYTDPSGHSWCGTAEYNYSNRADFAEQTVERTALGYLIRDDLNTYTAAALGVQCYGSNWNLDYMNSGVGPAQFSRNQINTTYGEPVDNNRGYGLRCWIPIRTILSSSPTLREFPLCGICKTDEEMTVMDEHYKNHYQLEQPQDPNEPAGAVEYMRRRIQQVLNMCRNCSATDKFIAAALGQNGPGLDPRDMEVLSSWSQDNPFRTNRNDPIDWMAYFRKRIEENGYRGWFDTSHQINLFSNVVWELGKRGWHIPSGLDRGLISTLANRRRP